MRNALLALVLTLPITAMGIEPYVLDASGNVVMTGTESCIRTEYWTPSLAAKSKFVLKCDRDLAPKIVPKHIEKIVLLDESKSLFSFDSATLTKSGKESLKSMIDPRVEDITEVIVEGYSDPIGGYSYNLKLSAARAKAVKSYIVSLGVPIELVSAIGRGETSAGVDCSKVAHLSKKITCNAENRRVMITLKYNNECEI